MRNIFKNNIMFIFILFVSLILPFRVDAKQTNTFIRGYNIDSEELISGDTVQFDNATTYIPVEDQNFKFYALDKVINFEYYIIDSIDSNGNIKYKKYDFSDLDRSAWYPDSSIVFDTSGGYFSDFEITAVTVDFYNSCSASRNNNNYNNNYLFSNHSNGFCNIVLPAVNGKISRWRFDSIDYGNKKDVEVCSYYDRYDTLYSSCDKAEGKIDNKYIGTYEYYTSYVYKFYEIPDEKPEVKFTCDSNKLSTGGTTKCKVKVSSKYALSNILFDITSEKLKINNFKINNYWENDLNQKSDYSKYWTFKEINDGYSINFTYDFFSSCYNPYDCGKPNSFEYLFDSSFNENPVVATFDVTSDEDIDDIVSSLKTTNFKYVDKTGDNTISDDNADSDNIINNILNPSTFKNSYYLIIGIIIIGGISFIQLRSKNKNK